MEGRFRKIPVEDVEIDPSRASGFPFNKKKGEALQLYSNFFRWYVRTGNQDRPDAFWKVTAKIEYLKMCEILENKIRLFRNPDLAYLLLEKMYFQQMDKFLMEFERTSWSALGFSKEYGGWDEFINILISKNPHADRIRHFYRWDLRFFDKSVGPKKQWRCDRLRELWFEKPPSEEEMIDLRFLFEQAGYSFEVLANGEVVFTAIAQKSGRFRTASDNTLIHIDMFCTHYIRVSKKYGWGYSFKDMMEKFNNYIYSDDIQGSTDFPEYLKLEDLEETFAMFGMGVKDYVMSIDPTSIHFLGATNKRVNGAWVPVYDEERMWFALVNLTGKISDEDRAQRISGLAHNLAFSEKYSRLICELAQHLEKLGRWKGVPLPDPGELKLAYDPAGRGRIEGSKFLTRSLPTAECLYTTECILTGQQPPTKITVGDLIAQPQCLSFISPQSSYLNYSLFAASNKMSGKEVVTTTIVKKQNPKKGQPRKKARNSVKKNGRIRNFTLESGRKPNLERQGWNPMDAVKGVPYSKRAKATNRYLQTVLDPETFSGIRYPDGYSRETAMLHLILNKGIPYLPGTVASGAGFDEIDTAGAYYAIFRPSLVHPVWFYEVYLEDKAPIFMLQQNNERFGMKSLTEGGLTASEQDGQTFLPKATIMNLKLPMILGNEDPVHDAYERQLADKSILYGHTFALGSSGQTAKIMITTSGPVTNTTDHLILTITNGVASVTVDIAATSADQTVWNATSGSLNGILTDLTTVDAGLGWCCGRKNSVGFRIEYTSATTSNKGLLLESVYVKFTSSATKQIGLHPTDWPELLEMLSVITRYRPVSASAWTQYQGSTLDNGGQHACIMYRGGEHPNQAKLYDYDQISETPGAYSNKMKIGSYQFWVPASTNDTSMRMPVNIEEWTHPYMAIAGNVGTTTQLNPLKLRVIMNLEVVSTSQFLQYNAEFPNLAAINQVSRVLHGCPTSMSNDGHWETIWRWLKNAAADTGKFVSDNAHWMVPLAKAGVALAL